MPSVEAIEGKHYSGDASSDFHAVMMSDPDVPINAFYFAKKNWMSPEDLADMMLESGMKGSRDELISRCQTQDVVGFCGDRQSETRGILFLLWMECKAGIRQESWEDLLQRLAQSALQDQ